jgi:hypothetical protein
MRESTRRHRVQGRGITTFHRGLAASGGIARGQMKSRQSGITLIGFLIVVAVVGFFGYMAMKLLPSYSEYMGVVKGMNQVAESGSSGRTLDDMRRELMFKMNFQYVDDATIKPADITLLREPSGANTLHVAYDKKIPFMYNIAFLLHFEKGVPLKAVAAQ